MTERLTLSYDTLVRFVDANALVHRYATRPMSYGGEWYDGQLADGVELQDSFNGGVSGGESIALPVHQTSGTALRLVVANSGLTGVSIVVRLIGTASDTAGVSSFEHAKTLTITAAELTPDGVSITAQDIEDARLDAEYPVRTWNADTFRDIADADAGMVIPYPIGTALKLRAASLFDDDRSLKYHYGVCEAPILTLPIIALSTGSKTFTVAGEYTDRISAGTVLFSSTGSANPGRYTVTGAVFGGVNTVVTVSETFSFGTVSGNLVVPPTVLAVYRDGRLVASTEYTVELLWPVATQMPDPDFDGAPVDWYPVNTGAGTAELTGGVGQFTGDGTVSNYARLTTSNTTAECQRGAFTAATITLASTGRARLNNFSVGLDGAAVVSGMGTHTAMVRQWYSDGRRRIDLSNYDTGYSGKVDVDNLQLNTTHRVLMVRFSSPQVSPQGQRYVIECDVRGVDSRNAANEIQRVLTEAGVSTDAGSFASVAAASATAKMWADIGYGRTGRNGGQSQVRTFRAHLSDLLRLARATLYRTVAGAYAIAQDASGVLPAVISTATGGRFGVVKFRRGDRPASVVVKYRPSGPDPSQLQGKKEFAITGGTTGKVETIEMPIIRDHETAERFASYLAKRYEFDATAEVEWHDKTDTLTIASLLVLADSAVYANNRNWMVWSVRPMLGGARLELREYDAAIYGYTPGALTVEPFSDYEPDYSQTLPLAPSALKITAGAAPLSQGGDTSSRVTVECIPPTVNWLSIMFAAVHNVTGEVFRAGGDDIGSGKRGTNIPNLRPGEVYQLKAWATNSFGVDGLAQGTFDATAIGGGGAVTTFTAPGYATLPANVASCTALQAMARMIRVTWPAVATTNLANYVLEKKVGAGAFAEVARPNANLFVDSDVLIGTSYQYRVKARDVFGNVSASYATSGTVVPVSNITGGPGTGDIGADTVGTGNRTGITTVTKSVAQPRFDWWLSDSIAHSMGKVPIAVIQSSFARCIASVSDRTSTTVTIAYAVCPTGTTNSNPTTPHLHTIEYGAGAGATMTIGADLW